MDGNRQAPGVPYPGPPPGQPYPGSPYPGPTGYGPPPGQPPPPERSKTGLIILAVTGVTVLLLGITLGGGYLVIRQTAAVPSASPSGRVPGVVSTAGDTVGATHVTPTEGCAPVNLKSFEATLGLKRSKKVSPNPAGQVTKYGEILTASECRVQYETGIAFGRDLTVHIATFVNRDSKASALKAYTQDIAGNTYSAPLTLSGVGEKATRFRSKAGNVELFVLDGNAVFDLQYSGTDSSNPKLVAAEDAALTALSQAVLTATASK